MEELTLDGKTILITGAGRRIGRALAQACAEAGADIIIHFNSAEKEALDLRDRLRALGRRAWALRADLGQADQVETLMQEAAKTSALYGLVNSAASFQSLSWQETTRATWEKHLAVNLTAPFFLSQAFARTIPSGSEGRIVNILDWRALRPGADHFPYTVSKSALAAMTKSLAVALAPHITVNALALGAILPPSDGAANPDILKSVPAGRWAELTEVGQALVFLLSGPSYITGEIVHVDGGRHLA